jgi:hypothetical protein
MMTTKTKNFTKTKTILIEIDNRKIQATNTVLYHLQYKDPNQFTLFKVNQREIHHINSNTKVPKNQ